MPGTESHRRQDEGEVDISSLRIASSEGKTTPVSNAAPLSQGTNKGQQDLPSPVKKIVLQPGTTVAELPYPNGTRISFHFETVATDDGTVYDDTRKHPKPMELIIGKKFKIDVWEAALHSMRKGEISKFEIPKELCVCYPMVAKVIRESHHPGESHGGGSCCGHLANGTGHPDLDCLVHKPKDLTFTFEILDINLPGQYEKEAWYMTDEEKVESIPELKAAGNKLFQSQDFTAAAFKYGEAASRLEQLLNKEQPGSVEFKELSSQKVPLLLNLALALLRSEVFYEAIRHCTSALEIEPGNVKALFRRGQGHKCVGNWDEARDDFDKALSLDPTLRKAVKEQLVEVAALEKKADEALKVAMKKMF